MLRPRIPKAFARLVYHALCFGPPFCSAWFIPHPAFVYAWAKERSVGKEGKEFRILLFHGSELVCFRLLARDKEVDASSTLLCEVIAPCIAINNGARGISEIGVVIACDWPRHAFV
jgi:hypothetical protein